MKYLVLDGDNVCSRNFYAMPLMREGDTLTTCMVGLLRDVCSLSETYETDRVLFCFDEGESKRKQMYPPYKLARHEGYALKDKRLLKSQLKSLREEWLAEVGFANVFCYDGYEADDVVAAVVKQSLSAKDEAVMVSSDKDLYQLLSGRVGMHDLTRKALYKEEDFRSEFGIAPAQWARVKAVAGCGSDCVPGVYGVGVKTAARYVAGKLGPSSRMGKKIASETREAFNTPLVTLPFGGCPTPEIKRDKITECKVRQASIKFGLSDQLLERLTERFCP